MAARGLSCSRQGLQSLLQHVGSSAAACQLYVGACGILFLDQGSNLGPLHLEHGILATGLLP